MSHCVLVKYSDKNKVHKHKIHKLINQFYGKVKSTDTHSADKLPKWVFNYGRHWKTTLVKQKRTKTITRLEIDFPTWESAARFRQAIEKLEWAHVC